MTYHSPQLAAAPHNPARVAALRCRDVFKIDPVPLLALIANQSSADAEITICRALEDIAANLDRLQLARTTSSYNTIPDPTRRIACVAGGLGLTDVQRVAGDVAGAAASGSGVAVSATLARLERCFDRAVSDVWDYKMQS